MAMKNQDSSAVWVCPRCGKRNNNERCAGCGTRKKTEHTQNTSGLYETQKYTGRNPVPFLVALLALLLLLLLLLGWMLLQLKHNLPEENSLDTVTTAPPTTQATIVSAETTVPVETTVTQVPVETAAPETTAVPTEEPYAPATIPPESELYSSADYLKVKPGENLFAVMPSYFEFCSGAGGWSTRLNLYEDGSFDGCFSDWNMGELTKDYLKGTCRMCAFSGEFSTPRKVTDYIYSVSVKRLNYPKDVDTEWIEDGARYIQATPYGLNKTSEYYIYLPGCPSSVFTEDQLTYIRYNTIVGRYDQIRQGNFAIYAQDGSSWLGFWGRKGDNVFSHDYEYQHGAFKSELQPYNYDGYDGSSLSFMTANGDPKIDLRFKWTEESQRTFVAKDKNGTGEYDINLYVKKDLQSVVVDVKSRQGTSLKAWGGTEDGQLTAVYSIITYNHASEETESVHLDKSEVKVGSYVRFGSYEQDNDPNDGKEPVEWRVLTLDKSGKKALLVSRHALAVRYFHNGSAYPTWANSNIRGWLNFNFWWDAFTDQEQSLIARTKLSNPAYEGTEGGPDTWDRVFLLSRGEAATYFSGSADRLVKPTLYALAMGAGTAEENGCCWWWLRTPGAYSYDAGTVYAIGGIDHTGANVKNATIAVRPAIWVELSD